jgi:hypothetical protein
MSACHVCGAETPAGAAHCPACGTFNYVPHPHIKTRRKSPPRRNPEPGQDPSTIARFNTFLGVKITNSVGTMWCAYGFAVIALISLPDALKGGTAPLIAWIAQTFLQLVLLSIIMVGQKVEGAASEIRAIDTYKDAEALLAEVVQIQKHLLAQDAWLQQLINAYNAQVQSGAAAGGQPRGEAPAAPPA